MKKLKKVHESLYWELLGLHALAKKHRKMMEDVEREIANALGIDGKIGDIGFVSELVYGLINNVDEMLDKEGIEKP